MSVMHITKNNFQKEVLENEKPVLVDFWAPWCAPCRMLSPILDEIAEENPQIHVAKVNVDVEWDLASQFKVVSIPTLLVMKDGEVLERAMGARPKQQILDLIL